MFILYTINIKNQILKQIENFKVEEIPENLIDQEVKILSQGMKEDEKNVVIK